MSLANALAIAAQRHGGRNVYRSRQHCVDVLAAIEAARPHWYTEDCAEFLQAVREVPLFGGVDSSNSGAVSNNSTHSCISQRSPTASSFPVIVLEGMDGSGKTTVAAELVRRLGAAMVRTPHPRYEKGAREAFRQLPEPLSRAFYSAANYLAAAEVAALRGSQPVLLDRWWGSTCSMALATGAAASVSASTSAVEGAATAVSVEALLPPEGSATYQWPEDLMRPTIGIVLDVPEPIRRRRAELRGGMRPEEEALAAHEAMRAAVKTAYRRMGDVGYAFVDTPTWPLTVNAVIALLEERSLVAPGAALRCTTDEVAAVAPF